MRGKKIIVIGSGFSGLSAACFLAAEGHQVTVLEKHAIPGGRARQLKIEGFTFDMGPSWYWMPDVLDRFFARFGKKREDYYQLKRLEPSYEIFWPNDKWVVPASYEHLEQLFERTEPGSSRALGLFLKEAGYKYEVGMQRMVYMPGQLVKELLNPDVLVNSFRLDLFRPVSSHLKKYFKHPRIRQLLEFPVLFLGAPARKIPALYTLMNYADVRLGTWYPGGGMYSIVEGMYQLGKELGAEFQFSQDVRHIRVNGRMATRVETVTGDFEADAIVASADYHHVESELLPSASRSYSEKYWQSRQMAPSCLIFYAGVSRKLPGLAHHTLFFDEPFDEHAAAIFDRPAWPEKPLFYVSCTSATDPSTAPAGCENLFILIPLASGLDGDSQDLRQTYFEQVIRRMEKKLGLQFREHILFSKSYAVSDFRQDYNAFRGNGYGLANTLRQTAHLKPGMRSKKVDNLFFAGQLTLPGPGVPPAIISGEMAARLVDKNLYKHSKEGS